jgi:2-polyprenyl-3-methyl-5-hydroxy-6-metoxy-1,4-benzoquinol methylase
MVKKYLAGLINQPLNRVGLRLSWKKTFEHLAHRESELRAEIGRLKRLREESEAQHRAELDRLTNPLLSPLANFTHLETLGITKRRQEHLESLGLEIAGRSVLEVGAGIGEHTSFFLDRACKVLSTDGRAENIATFRERYFGGFSWYSNLRNLQLAQLDIDNPPEKTPGQFDIVYCYGTLYHLEHPQAALQFLSRCCTSLLLLETSVSFGCEEVVELGEENAAIINQSIHGKGCHPSRPWVFRRLKELFEFVYMPITQPWHDQFPTDWVHRNPTPGRAQRAIFVASREKLDCPKLVEKIPEHQTR